MDNLLMSFHSNQVVQNDHYPRKLIKRCYNIHVYSFKINFYMRTITKLKTVLVSSALLVDNFWKKMSQLHILLNLFFNV